MSNFPTQTLFKEAVALEGLLVDGRSHNEGDILSRFAANAAIAPGRFCCFHAGDADDQVRAPATAAEAQGMAGLGVTVLDVTALNNPYAVGDPTPVLRHGRIWVVAEDGCDPDDDVYVRITSDGGSHTSLGTFRNDGDSGKCVRVAGLKWMSTAGTGELAELEVNLIGIAASWWPTGP